MVTVINHRSHHKEIWNCTDLEKQIPNWPMSFIIQLVHKYTYICEHRL